MNTCELLINLLGKSELDEKVKIMLAEFGVTDPLKRPKRDENIVYVKLRQKYGIELLFTVAESMKSNSALYSEGELIFSDIFFFPSHGKNIEKRLGYPFGVPENLTRKAAYKLLGQPFWSNPFTLIKSDKWLINDTILYIQFDKTENEIQEVSILYE